MTSLAVSDLLVGVFELPGVVASALGGWPFGDMGCTVVYVCIAMAFSMSVNLIICLNIERFIAVTRPYKFPVWCTRSRVKTFVLFLAIISFCFSLFPVFTSTVSTHFNDIMQICDYVNAPILYHVCVLLLGDIFPSLLMSYIYYRLIKISCQHEQRLNQNGRNEANNNHDNRALKTFLVVTLTFAGCYTPHLAMRTATSLSGLSPPDWLQFLTAWLVASNSMFNVIIYCLFNKAFRQTAKKIIVKRFPCCNRSVAPVDIAL